MGEPIPLCGIFPAEFIGSVKLTRGIETSQYPEGREINRDSESSGERNRMSLNRCRVKPECVAMTVLQELRGGSFGILGELQTGRLVEDLWKGSRYRVIVP